MACFKLGKRHLLLDSPLHPDQSDPELVFKEFADAPDPSVAEMIDIIDLTLACPEAQDISDYFYNVLISKHLCLKRYIKVQTFIEFQPANRRKVIPLGIKEQTVKQVP